MKTLSFFLVFTVAHVVCCCAGEPPHKPGDAPQVAAPIGRLGYPIGTYLTIEGIRAEKFKSGTHTLLVERIGDYTLTVPVGLWIENVELPEGVRCVLKGYETGRWIGVPDEVMRAFGGPPPQVGWQFDFYFLATSVEQPSTLKLK